MLKLKIDEVTVIRVTKSPLLADLPCSMHTTFSTVTLIDSASCKKLICLQALKVGANDRSAQELFHMAFLS